MCDDRNPGLIKDIQKFLDYIDPYDNKPIDKQPSWMRFVRPVVYSKPYTFLESFWWSDGLQLPSVEKPKRKPVKCIQVYPHDYKFSPQQIEEAKKLALDRVFSKYVRATTPIISKNRSTYSVRRDHDRLLNEAERRYYRDVRNIEAGKFSPRDVFNERLKKELPGDDAGSSKSPERIQQEMWNPSGRA